jgi:hypothetical protein
VSLVQACGKVCIKDGGVGNELSTSAIVWKVEITFNSFSCQRVKSYFMSPPIFMSFISSRNLSTPTAFRIEPLNPEAIIPKE